MKFLETAPRTSPGGDWVTRIRRFVSAWGHNPAHPASAAADHQVAADRQAGDLRNFRVDHQGAARPASLLMPPFQEQKMEALGRLTAGVAHDFNNLLTIILGNASALRVAAEARGDGADARRAQSIEGAAQRGGRLAEQLLAFSRRQILHPEVLSAYRILSGLHDLISRAAGESVQIRLLGDTDLWSCRIDPGQLESAILNLVFNSHDAMPFGGTVTITCRNERVGLEEARKSGRFSGEYIRLDIADTGTGIAPELLERVFEPFFTTKPVGKGSGLGLAQVHGFAGQSGGWTEIRSAIGQGTTVSLLLPRYAEAGSNLPSIGEKSAAAAPKAHVILLVEPDQELRRAVGETLRLAGHRVHEAWDDFGARRWVASHEPLQLLITKVSLPGGRSGVELACNSRRSRPDLLTLLMSGSRPDDAIRRLGGGGHCDWLSEPCRTIDIIQVSEALLRGECFSTEREQLHSELRGHSVSSQSNSFYPHLPRPPPRSSLHQRTSGLRSIKPAAVRLGVLPVKALDSSLMHEFSLGLAEELTTALARFRWISCVSPTSIAALAEEEEISESTRWADLDLDFLVEGSFRQSGPDIQIIVRLINMREPGEISWSKRFDSRFEDVLKLQDQIAADTAAQVAPELLLWGGGQATTRPQVDPSSYELMLRSIPAIYRLDQSGFRAAGPFLKKALQLDPSNAAAHSWLAHWYTSLVGQGWANDTRYAAQQADIHGKRAVLLDPGDARGLTVAGHVRAFLYKQPDPGLELHEQALNLNPNLALAWCYSGLANSYAGHHSEAFEHIRHAQLLSPHDPHGFFFDMALVMPLLLIGDYKTAVQVGRRAREAHPGLSSTYKGLISALGCMGNLGEARTLRQQLALLEPNFSVQEAIKRSPLCRPEDVQCYADGLRLAGCDERARGSPLADCLRPIATRWKQSRWLDEKAG